jgi:uncharacterized protein YbjT (DUF2867 family)
MSGGDLQPMKGQNMASDLVVVLGATGHVGRVIADRLLAAGRRVRVVARSTGALAALAKRGAEAAAGDATDGAFLRGAFEGAAAAFVLLPPYLGPGIRGWQDRTAATIGDALEAARVPRSVTLSSIGADRASGNGPIAGLHVLEKRLEVIGGLAPLHLRPGYFFENNLGLMGLIRSAGVAGGMIRADLPMAQIATRDIGEAAARRLLAGDWSAREVMELHGERDLAMRDVAGALGRSIGKPDLAYVQFPYDQGKQGLVQAGLPAELAELYADMARAFNEGLGPTQPRSTTSTTPTSIEAWANEVFAPAFRG